MVRVRFRTAQRKRKRFNWFLPRAWLDGSGRWLVPDRPWPFALDGFVLNADVGDGNPWQEAFPSTITNGQEVLEIDQEKIDQIIFSVPATPAEVGAATDCWGAFPNHAFGTSCDAAVTGRLSGTGPWGALAVGG
jgi:hypothetical protein